MESSKLLLSKAKVGEKKKKNTFSSVDNIIEAENREEQEVKKAETIQNPWTENRRP